MRIPGERIKRTRLVQSEKYSAWFRFLPGLARILGRGRPSHEELRLRDRRKQPIMPGKALPLANQRHTNDLRELIAGVFDCK